MVLEAPRKDGGDPVGDQGVTARRWWTGLMARQRSAGEEEAVGNVQQTSAGMVKHCRRIDE